MYKHPVDPKKSILKIGGEGSSTNITYYSEGQHAVPSKTIYNCYMRATIQQIYP
jgi:hypothetical protein